MYHDLLVYLQVLTPFSFLEYFVASLCMRASNNSNLYNLYFVKRKRKHYMYDFLLLYFNLQDLYPHFPMHLV